MVAEKFLRGAWGPSKCAFEMQKPFDVPQNYVILCFHDTFAGNRDTTCKFHSRQK